MSATLSQASVSPSVYAAFGAVLVSHSLDEATGQLTEKSRLTLPARVQYAWAHPILPIIYAGCADRGSSAGTLPFYICAITHDATGALSLHGDPVTLTARPIHITVDIPGRHVLTAYGEAPGLSVHEINADGTVGNEVPRVEPFEFGVKPHQVRVSPSNDRAVLVARGAKGFGTPSYAEGGFKLVSFDQDKVENLYTATPPAAQAPRGFNPRNVDFHPTLPLMYATMEAQNQLGVFAMNGGDVEPALLYLRDILANPEKVHKRQDGGEVHVHPNGGYAYVANRNDGYVTGHDGPSWLTPDPIPVFPGGENNIAVFRLDEKTGEPTLIQHAEGRGIDSRALAFTRDGRFLVASHIAPTLMPDGDKLNPVAAGLSVFRVGNDGKLEFIHKLDIDTGQEKLLWMGVVG